MSSFVLARDAVKVSAPSMLSTGSWGSSNASEVSIGCSLENTMATTLTFSSTEALADLRTFLQRAGRVNNSSARVIAGEGFLQVYVGILVPRGLLDRTPTVLGLRVSALAEAVQEDTIVPMEAFIHRLGVAAEARLATVTLPASVPSLAWAAITPPREHWRRRKSISGSDLQAAAQQGIARVAEAVPDNSGEAILQKVRAEVWGEIIPQAKRIPAGAGFAADALGFLAERSLSVHSTGPWVRVSSKGGYVLVKFPTGHDFGPDTGED